MLFNNQKVISHRITKFSEIEKVYRASLKNKFFRNLYNKVYDYLYNNQEKQLIIIYNNFNGEGLSFFSRNK